MTGRTIFHRSYRAKDIINRLNTDFWEVTSTNRDAWRHSVKLDLSQYEETLRVKAEEKRLPKKTLCLTSRPTTSFTFSKCDKDCFFHIGLRSHNRRWSFETDRCQWLGMHTINHMRLCCVINATFTFFGKFAQMQQLIQFQKMKYLY